jgi:hypothetical protein
MIVNLAPRELFKDAKKSKFQSAIKHRKDSYISERKTSRTFSKLFEVVKCP